MKTFSFGLPIISREEYESYIYSMNEEKYLSYMQLNCIVALYDIRLFIISHISELWHTSYQFRIYPQMIDYLIDPDYERGYFDYYDCEDEDDFICSNYDDDYGFDDIDFDFDLEPRPVEATVYTIFDIINDMLTAHKLEPIEFDFDDVLSPYMYLLCEYGEYTVDTKTKKELRKEITSWSERSDAYLKCILYIISQISLIDDYLDAMDQEYKISDYFESFPPISSSAREDEFDNYIEWYESSF